MPATGRSAGRACALLRRRRQFASQSPEQPAAHVGRPRREPAATARCARRAAAPGSTEPIKPMLVKTITVKAGARRPRPLRPWSLSAPRRAAQLSTAAGRRRSPAAPVERCRRPRQARSKRAARRPARRTGVLGRRQPRQRDGRQDSAGRTADSGTRAGAEAQLAPLPQAQCRARAPGNRRPLPVRSARRRAVDRRPSFRTASRRSGWIIQVGAYRRAEQEAKQRLSAVQSKASQDARQVPTPFTETFVKGGNHLLSRPLRRPRQGQGGSRLQISQA